MWEHFFDRAGSKQTTGLRLLFLDLLIPASQCAVVSAHHSGLQFISNRTLPLCGLALLITSAAKVKRWESLSWCHIDTLISTSNWADVPVPRNVQPMQIKQVDSRHSWTGNTSESASVHTLSLWQNTSAGEGVMEWAPHLYIQHICSPYNHKYKQLFQEVSHLAVVCKSWMVQRR